MKIKQVTLYTSQLESLKRFYSEVLSISVIDSTESAFTLRIGQTQLTFRQGDSYLYHVAFNIPQNQFAEGKAWLSERVSLLDIMGKDEIRFTNWNAHSVYFYDSAGNIMEFIAHHDLNNDSDIPFSSGSLCSVSEIGIATTDVMGLTQSLQDNFDLSVYDGDSSDDFCPIGDAEGLLIVVAEGRGWFPNTGIQAQHCPLEVVVDNGNMISYQQETGYQLTRQGTNG